MDKVTQNNFYAVSPFFGRKSGGTFFGLDIRNRSKRYKVRASVVCWQTWYVEIVRDINGEILPRTNFYIKQTGEETPTLVLKDTRLYKHGWNVNVKNAEIYS